MASRNPLRTVAALGVPTLLLCSTPAVSHTFGRSTYGLLVPAIEDDLGLTHAQSGLGGTAIFAAYVVGIFAVAMLAPRLEPIDLMRGGLAIAAIGLIVSTMATGLAMLVIGLALTGGAGAGIWITAPVLATASVDADKRGLVIGLLSSGMGLTATLVGLGTKILWVGDDGAWRPVWLAEATWTFAVFLGTVLLVRLKRTAPVDGGFSISLVKTVPGWGRLIVGYALFGGLAAGFGAFSIAALEEDGGLDRSTTSTVFLVMGLIGVVAAPAFGAMSDRVGRRAMLLASMTGLISACFIVALGRGLVVALGVVLYGSFAGAFPTLVASYIRDHADARAFSRVFATITMVYTLVAVALPITVGSLADRTGSFTAPYLLLGVMGIGSLVLVAGLPGRSADATTVAT